MPTNEKFCGNYAESFAVSFALNHEKPKILKIGWTTLLRFVCGFASFCYDC